MFKLNILNIFRLISYHPIVVTIFGYKPVVASDICMVYVITSFVNQFKIVSTEYEFFIKMIICIFWVSLALNWYRVARIAYGRYYWNLDSAIH